jgi:hypothetical protein
MSAALSYIASALYAVLDWLWQRIAAAIGYVFDLIIAAFSAALEFAYTMLEPLVGEHLQTAVDAVPWAAVWGMCEDVAWILPVREVVVVIVITLTASASIRVVRFVIGWIPTIEG